MLAPDPAVIMVAMLGSCWKWGLPGLPVAAEDLRDVFAKEGLENDRAVTMVGGTESSP